MMNTTDFILWYRAQAPDRSLKDATVAKRQDGMWNAFCLLYGDQLASVSQRDALRKEWKRKYNEINPAK